MGKPAKSIAVTLLQAFSKVIGVFGGLTFFFGDRALREFAGFSFASAEMVGISSGILLMCLAYAISETAKKVSTEQRAESK